MITEADRIAAECVARGEEIPPAIEYALLVEEFKRAYGQERQKIWERIEQIKNANGGFPPVAKINSESIISCIRCGERLRGIASATSSLCGLCADDNFNAH